MDTNDPYGFNSVTDSPLLSLIANHPSLNSPQGGPQVIPSQPQPQQQSQDQTHFSIGHAIGQLLSGGNQAISGGSNGGGSQVNETPTNVPVHSLTGILGIHGVPGQLLNWLGDTIGTAAGMRLPFADDPQKRAEAQAMQGFSNDPYGSVDKLAATGDTQGAIGLHNSLVNQEMVAQQRQMQAANYQSLEAQRKQAVQSAFLKRAGATFNGIDGLDPSVQDQTYQSRRQNIYKTAASVGLSPDEVDSELQLPSTYKQGALDTAVNYGTPVVKLTNSDSQRIAAEARARSAETGAAIAPSVINRNNAQAAAAPANAASNTTRAQAAAGQAGVARDRYDSQTGQNGAPPIQKPSRGTGRSGNGLPTISKGSLPAGAQTFNGGKIAKIGNNYVNVQ